MKNSVLLLTAIIISMGCAAQKMSESKLPQAVKNGFKKAHPNAKATWDWEDANYEANFKEDGKTMSCVMDKQGTILETETVISAKELPSAAQTYLDKQYKGRHWKEAARIVKAGGAVNHEVNIGGKDIVFDNFEKLLRKKD